MGETKGEPARLLEIETQGGQDWVRDKASQLNTSRDDDVMVKLESCIDSSKPLYLKRKRQLSMLSCVNAWIRLVLKARVYQTSLMKSESHALKGCGAPVFPHALDTTSDYCCRVSSQRLTPWHS